MAKKLRSQLNHETKKGSSVSSVSCNPAAGGTATTARRQREATVAAVKFPPAGQAASERASHLTNLTHTYTRTQAGTGQAATHAHTQHSLSQATSSAAASPAQVLPHSATTATAGARAEGIDRQGNYSIRLSHSYLRPRPSSLASSTRTRQAPANLGAIYVTRPATDSVTWSAFPWAATEGSLSLSSLVSPC